MSLSITACDDTGQAIKEGLPIANLQHNSPANQVMNCG